MAPPNGESWSLGAADPLSPSRILSVRKKQRAARIIPQRTRQAAKAENLKILGSALDDGGTKPRWRMLQWKTKGRLDWPFNDRFPRLSGGRAPIMAPFGLDKEGRCFRGPPTKHARILRLGPAPPFPASSTRSADALSAGRRSPCETFDQAPSDKPPSVHQDKKDQLEGQADRDRRQHHHAHAHQQGRHDKVDNQKRDE